MAKGQTIRERISSRPPGSGELIALWNEGLVDNMLRLVWDAYDQLRREFPPEFNWSEDYDDLERSISMELEPLIRNKMDGFMPVSVQHSRPEHESRSASKRNAKPPEYDIAFFCINNPRLMWPLEAKVLKSDNDTASNLDDYIQTINTRYLTCYYAPFSNAGAMIGYLKTGDAEAVAESIANRLGCCLSPYIRFPSRCHRTSDHDRKVPPGKNYPLNFRCHHLIMPLGRNTVS